MSIEARLCRMLVEEDFGPFTAEVANQLLLKGPLDLDDIVRFTQLTQEKVHESLVVSIHHALVYFTEPEEGSADPTYYQADATNIMMRLRIGPIMRATEERYGREALNIIKSLFTNGRMRLSGVLEWVAEYDNNPETKRKTYINAFKQLVMSGLIIALLPEHSRSPTDRLLLAEEKNAQKYTITSAMDTLVRKTAERQIDAEPSMMEGIGMKRMAVDALGGEEKRLAVARGDDMHQIDIDEKAYFAINYEKYNMIFRNNMIVDFATERINSSAGHIVKALLEHGKDKMKMIKEEDSAAASPTHIVNLVPLDVLTRGDIVLRPDPKDPNRKPSPQEVVKGYLSLLKADKGGFIKSKDEMGTSQYAVNFAKLRNTMRRRVFESILQDKYGLETCRIVRILLDKGKLEESQVQKLAMLPAGKTREKLGLLNLKGIVEIEEVSKSEDCSSARTIYLWYIPLEKCYQELLTDVCRTIGNLQQRKQEELRIRNSLVEALNRSDVIDDMNLLSEADKAEAQRLQKVVEQLEVSKMRLDEMVMLFRDF